MALDQLVRQRAEDWCKLDPNQATSKYVMDLLEASAASDASAEELDGLFPNDRIGFGTAGLRAAMTPGPMGMNDLVVVQAAQGIAKYVLEQNSTTQAADLRVVIGYDHRENKSLELSSLSFALLSALAFRAAGLETILLDGFVATPLVPFTLTRQNCAVGIMITASHNPKEDAGYKVYWSNGCQIRAPVDKGIADSILNSLTPWEDYGTLLITRKQQHATDPCLGLSNPSLTKDMVSAYFDAITTCGLVTGQASLLKRDGWEPPSIAYTAMHGVGYPFAVRSYETFGFPPFHAVPSQMNPDPTFPTVPFPNPEERGALNIAKAFAEENGCDIVLANDPDADRLAVAERDRITGEWTVFDGDQIGTMLGCWLYEMVGKPSGKVSSTVFVIF
jgi:phosphomannomutase